MSVKREFDSTESVSAPAKKLKFDKALEPLDELSDAGLLSQEDVTYYQKEAIYRMLSLVRHRNRRLQRELKNVSANYSNLREYYSVLDGWWSQLVDDLKAQGVLDTETNEISAKLLLPVPDKDPKLSEQLSQKRAKLLSLLTPLLSKPLTAKRDEKVADLQENVSSLASFKGQLEDENRMLKEKIEDLNLELDKYIRTIERKSSKTLDRISDNLHEDEKEGTPAESANGTAAAAADSTANGGAAAATGSAASAAAGAAAAGAAAADSEAFTKNKQELEDLKVQLSGLLAENKSQASELDDKSAKVAELGTLVAQLKSAMTNLSEEQLGKSAGYQALLSKNSDLSSQLSKLRYDGSKIESHLHDLESKFTANQQKLQAQLKAEIDGNNGYIGKLESDLNRIRSDRDALQAKVSALKAEKGKSELTEEYRHLNETLQKRIAELEDKSDADLAEAIAKAPEDVDALKRHNAIISRELKQLEEAFKTTRKSAADKLAKYADADSYMNKLQVEKAKADEKYFQAMRTKDSLSMQNKILNTSILKQSELIEALRNNEKKLLQKLEVEQHLFDKMKELESVYNNELTFQKGKNRELDKKLATLQLNNAELQADNVKKQDTIGSMDKKISQLESRRETLESKLASQEKLVEKYRSNTQTAEDEEINQALLTMTKCQLCNKNFKNVTLKVCGHCFCSDCIHNRLASRMRKCPNCNKQFSNYDLLEIHL